MSKGRRYFPGQDMKRQIRLSMSMRGRRAWRAVAISVAAIATLATPISSHADERGISFWVPGFFGSFASVPTDPGWGFTSIYYHTSVSSSAGANFQVGGKIVAGLGGQADLALYGVTYTFAQPVAGGQFALSMLNVAGRNAADVSATLTGPLGREISGARSDSLTAFGDLIPVATLKWNSGVSNFMIYGAGDIPVGSYDPNRLANLGIGHGAADGGVGYTYLNPATGWEFSATGGLTYNLENTFTNYQNGVDGHLDWGLSRFLTKQFDVGLVGYFYQQLTPDSGSGDKVGAFESNVAAIGGQANYLFPIGDQFKGVFSMKIYKELYSKNRPDGWNAWFTINISEALAQAKPVTAKY
jgi:hypothetical protein